MRRPARPASAAARLLARLALFATLAVAAPARAGGHTGHVRVVRGDTQAAVLIVTVHRPGAANPAQAKVTVLLDADVGHLVLKRRDGSVLSLRFGVHREGPGLALFATADATQNPERVGPLAVGGTLTFPAPGRATVAVTLEKVASVSALRRR